MVCSFLVANPDTSDVGLLIGSYPQRLALEFYQRQSARDHASHERRKA